MSGEQKTAAASIVAKKHGLGNNLVTGHKVEYWHEAMDIYADQQNAALKEMIGDILASYEQYGELPSDIIDCAKKLIAENREQSPKPRPQEQES